MIEGDFGGEWDSEPRQSRLVFIGRNLVSEELRDGFESCRPAVIAEK
jgi:hypothetical protein